MDSQRPPENLSDDEPLYKGANCTLASVLLAILSFSLAHRLSATCLQDLLSLLKLILPADNKLIGSLHYFFKYFEMYQKSGTRHYYCTVCSSSLASKDAACEKCGPANHGVHFFISVSVTEQLKKLFQVPEFVQNLSYAKDRVKIQHNAVEDIYDGQCYIDAQRIFAGVSHWLTLLWNTDGFSVFKSSKYEIWPFYLCVNELSPWLRFRKQYALLGGLWFGVGKPDPNLFLKPLFEELCLLKQGVLFHVLGFAEALLYKIGLLAGTLDAPAKSLFLGMIGFNGLFGCPKCLSRGEKSDRTSQIFVHPYSENLTLRTEAIYVEHLTELRRLRNINPNFKAFRGVTGPTILKNMVLSSLIPSTSVDIMHCLFQGCMKTLIVNLWFCKDLKDEIFSIFERRDVVSDFLCKIKPPHCIERIPQSLDKIKFWKASEYMAFFFYYGLPILNLVLKQIHFNHFKLLVSGIVLLSKESIIEDDLILSQTLLDEFVKQYETLYGLKRMTYNLHVLRHLPGVVRQLGPLWTSSCFMFENLNGALKYVMHGTQQAGVQVQNYFEILTQLPTMIKDLEPSKLKDHCLKMSSANARLNIYQSLDPEIEISSTLKYQNTDIVDKIPVHNITGLCVNVIVDDN
ncbi:hypothetical protein FOCC_FOCC017792, partial [Frankliniella occidentalis]